MKLRQFLIYFFVALCLLINAGEVFAGFNSSFLKKSYLSSLLSYHSYKDWDCEMERCGQLSRLGVSEAVSLEDSSNHDTQMNVFTLKDKQLVIAFRGSEAGSFEKVRKDWLETDFRVNFITTYSKILNKDVLVHRGFWFAVDGVFNDLLSRLGPPKSHNKALWLTGHSLGGALAKVAAFRLKETGYPVAGVITFAAPKVSDGSLRLWYKKTGLRLDEWVNNNDPVPQLPLSGKVLGSDQRRFYTHEGTLNVIKTSGQVQFDGKFNKVPDITIGAHSMAGYANALYNNLAKSVQDSFPLPSGLQDELSKNHEACSASSSCVSYSCKNLRCVAEAPLSLSKECLFDFECESGRCSNAGGVVAILGGNKVAGKCVCKRDSDCGENQWCRNGPDLKKNRCFDKQKKGEHCSSKSQCLSGRCGAIWPFSGTCK